MSSAHEPPTVAQLDKRLESLESDAKKPLFRQPKLYLPWLLTILSILVGAYFSLKGSLATHRTFVANKQSEFRDVMWQLMASVPPTDSVTTTQMSSSFQRRTFWRQHKDINTILLIESCSEIAKSIPDDLNAADHLSIAVFAMSASGFDSATYHCNQALKQLNRDDHWTPESKFPPKKPLLRGMVLSVLGMLHYYHPTLEAKASIVTGGKFFEQAKQVITDGHLVISQDYLATIEGQWALACAAAKQFDDAAEHFATAVSQVKTIESFACPRSCLLKDLQECAMQLKELGVESKTILAALNNDKAKSALLRIGVTDPKVLLQIPEESTGTEPTPALPPPPPAPSKC